MSKFIESTVEDAALSWLDELDYSELHGPEIAPGEPAAERASLSEAILPERLRSALGRLNPNVAAEALDEVFRKLSLIESPSLIVNNRSLHRMLVDGIAVEYQQPMLRTPTPNPSPKGGGEQEPEYQRRHDIVRVIDFDDPDANDWMVVNQFTVIEGQRNRRPDVVIFVNGLPLAVIELKNAADQDATLWDAFNQIQTYKVQIPSIFLHNAVAVISDGLEARVGTISADKERFMPWRTVEGETLAPVFLPQLEVLLRGVFDKRRFLDLIRHFIVFEEDTSDGTIIKKMAGYHQFHAVNTAVEATLRAVGVRTLTPGPSPRGRGGEEPVGGDRRTTPLSPLPNPLPRGEGVRTLDIPAEGEGGRKSASIGRGRQYRGGYQVAGLVERARELRKKQTTAEALLWELLRNRQFLGFKFRRQHQFGDYIADFYCHEAQLVIECDGGVHNPNEAWHHDQERDAYMIAQGLRVLRFTNERILNETENVLKEIAVYLPSPPGRGAGGEGLQTGPEQVKDLLPSTFGGGAGGGGAESSRHGDESLEQGRHAGQIGVIWHTQGSGKSLTMVFYAGRLVLHPAMENPTIVVLTDRNDLDEQLFGTFSRCQDLLRQTPVQAMSRDDLQKKLRVQSGGIVFTTIQKFFPDEKRAVYPTLSERRNIVVIADEAHRSQYDFIDGFARHMHDALPNASFIGFTGTPIELKDANTRAVFGDYISIYDIQRAVEDKATVPIYYEGRLAKLGLDEKEKPKIDPDFEEATEGEEVEHKEKLKTKWAALEAVVGADKRLRLIADDLVRHWEARLEVMDGKAMIVCMSRRICFELYEAIRRLRPDWHDDDDTKGVMKIVMTGAAPDPLTWQPHIRTKKVREDLAKRFKNPKDPFKVVIVRDMWLTGFDVPCLHTMYVDKPMRGHGLMQAIARVNRVFGNKPGGLVVDYLGLAQDLKKALAVYTESGGKGRTAVDQEEAVEAMLEKYEICSVLFHGFDWSLWTKGTPAQKLSLLPPAQEHILKEADGKERLLKSVNELSLAFALAVPHSEAIRIRDDVGFFQAVRSAIAKETFERRGTVEEMNFAIRQIISRAISSDEVLDIFAAAGLKKPDISILSDEFLGEVRGMPQKNLAVELLRKLLTEEIRVRSRRNLVQSRLFSEMLQKAILKYQNRAIETAAVIEELVGLARDMREAAKRGEALNLTDDEVAFYDALEVNDSAVKVLGDENLRIIARELVETVRRNVTIDWTAREAVRAKLRTMVKRILRKHGYPPDKQEKATQTVLEQAELLCKDWAL